jgi:hypothetical protein
MLPVPGQQLVPIPILCHHNRCLSLVGSGGHSSPDCKRRRKRWLIRKLRENDVCEFFDWTGTKMNPSYSLLETHGGDMHMSSFVQRCLVILAGFVLPSAVYAMPCPTPSVPNVEVDASAFLFAKDCSEIERGSLLPSGVSGQILLKRKGSVTWVVNVVDPDNTPLLPYRIDFGYAPKAGQRLLDVFVNGVLVKPKLEFPNSGSTVLRRFTDPLIVNLRPGHNRIQLAATGQRSPFLEKFDLSPVHQSRGKRRTKVGSFHAGLSAHRPWHLRLRSRPRLFRQLLRQSRSLVPALDSARLEKGEQFSRFPASRGTRRIYQRLRLGIWARYELSR